MSNPSVGEFKLPDNVEPPKKNNNTKWIAAAIVAGMGLFGYLVQTDNNSYNQVASGDTVTSTPVKPATPPKSSAAMAEEVYLLTVHTGYPASKYASDRDLIELGYDACALFDSGVTVDEYAYFVAQEFLYDEDAQMLAASVAGAALGALCPEHSWMLDY